ncbi:SDR family NAD(P)-dependent oxidoreductase [Methylovulum miyakonense]|uniref:SDR family NAD(P)-dependent oxidoreductase n=1 Tax=Methylovulum miyakonense TaxID=645578 RepID=UPI00036602A4|nr:SDR family NAD(P)-dependent oxidoreductase [Methylovulum miyakonense]
MMLAAPTTILVTGATGAIGGALARHYAKPGICLILQGRNAAALDGIARACTEAGASVSTQVMDLRDIAGLQQWLAELSIKQLPDLVIANAGININHGSGRRGEQWPEMEALLDLNVKSTLALANALVPAMRQRRSGQIALVSSLAAYYGLPVTPSYSASKAAIKAYGEGMRGWLERDNVQINVVMPGYIQSDMANAMPGPKPFLWAPDRAARVIAQGLAKNQARISFPFPLNFGTWFLAVLPAQFSQRILALIGYKG